MDEVAFRRFVPLLVRTATRDAYAIAAGSVTFVAVIPYFVVYGATHGWYTAGIAVFVLSSVLGKVLDLPAYQRIEALTERDAVQLRVERRRLQRANWVRVLLCAAAVLLMVVEFS